MEELRTATTQGRQEISKTIIKLIKLFNNCYEQVINSFLSIISL